MLPTKPAIIPPKIASPIAANTLRGWLKAKGARSPGIGEAVPGGWWFFY